jgi:hypothetical protein
VNTTAFTIVLNGALTIEQCIRHHAPLFDRYVVVEGAAMRCKSQPRGDGRWLTGGKKNSTDGTVEILQRLEDEIPNLKVIYAKKVWNGKLEMFQEALNHTDYGLVWQIDSDEYWRPSDVSKMNRYMESETHFTDAEFWAFHFWSSPFLHTELKPTAWGNIVPWRRLFRFSKGDSALSHEPPLMRRRNKDVVARRTQTSSMGVYLFHYGYCLREQFRQREVFYNLKEGELTQELDAFLGGCGSPPCGALVEYKRQHPISIDFLLEKRNMLAHSL